MNFQNLKQEYINGLLETNAFIIKSIDEDPFTLRNGKTSRMFLDHSRVASSPKAYRAFIDVIVAKVQETYGQQEILFCNVDSKISAQMVGSAAYVLKKPQIVFKSTALTTIEKGTKMQLTGNDEWDMPVALLDDVMTGGDGTAKNVADLVKERFPHITDIQIFAGFTRDVKKSTYPSHHILTRDELIAKVWDKLTVGQQQAIEREKISKE